MTLIEFVKNILKNVFTEEVRVDYICGSGEALPLPLSTEEEGELLRVLALEEEREKERAKTELIQHNLRLVVYIARKFDNTGVENDDLVSIGTIGLIKAINSFKAHEDEGSPLSCQVKEGTACSNPSNKQTIQGRCRACRRIQAPSAQTHGYGTRSCRE